MIQKHLYRFVNNFMKLYAPGQKKRTHCATKDSFIEYNSIICAGWGRQTQKFAITRIALRPKADCILQGVRMTAFPFQEPLRVLAVLVHSHGQLSAPWTVDEPVVQGRGHR